MHLINRKKWFSIASLLIAFTFTFAVQAERPGSIGKKGLRQDELGQRFTQLVSEQNFREVDKLINYDAYATRMARLVFDSNAQQTAFKRGFMQQLKQITFSERIFVAASTEPTTYKYMGLNKKRVPVIRIDFTEGGHEYIKLITRPNSKGQLRVEDFMFASTGDLSSVGAANATKYLIQPSESILKRLLGGTEPNKELLADFEKLGKLRVEGKNKQGYDLIQTFPDNLKNQKELLLTSINLSSVFDENAYRSELSKLARLYGDDPRQAFMLVDHYFYEEDWSEAINAIKASMREWGDDGALNILLAEVLFRDGQLSAAADASQRAVKLEPNNENMYWSALKTYSKAARFEDAVTVLTTLRDQFSYEFNNDLFINDPENSELTKSNAFKDWIE